MTKEMEEKFKKKEVEDAEKQVKVNEVCI